MQDDDAKTPMERFEDFGRKIFRVTKGDPQEAQEAVEKVVDEAIGPPPAKSPALAEDDD